jgi:hypothetical protein
MDEDEDRRQFASGAVYVQSLDLGRAVGNALGLADAMARQFARFFLKTKLSPFLPSDIIEGGLCLLGQSNTQKSIWLDFASLGAYSGALGFRPHAVA